MEVKFCVGGTDISQAANEEDRNHGFKNERTFSSSRFFHSSLMAKFETSFREIKVKMYINGRLCDMTCGPRATESALW